MENIFTRTELLIGKQGVETLKNSKVIIFGVGGVGSFVCEALARAGVGNLILVDKDIVDVTNINRQIIALQSTIGKIKVEVMKERILDINPLCNVTSHKVFLSKENIEELIPKDIDYVVDAIDTVTSKIDLAVWCCEHNIKIISSMGTGKKLDPTKFKIDNIYNTKVCPLAKVMRKQLKIRGIKKLKVLYSEEIPIQPKLEECGLENTEENRRMPSSISFVPSCAGLIIGGEVIKDIIKNEY
ncbi:ThiF family adenylyltransferase [Haloimpatiens sp. FM7330]|uniref:tRNA threonylcarbamoyladenosine dehydratase n=1 Tax=Haloimpatiens sp. FM7330 TaxID=3298610 RepID=UPI003625C7E5